MVNSTAKSESTGPTAGTEIVLKSGATIQVREADPNEVAKFLSGGMLTDQQDESVEEITRQMVSQVFAAETAEEIFGAGTARHIRDYLDYPLTILNVKWNKTAIADKDGNPQGMPVFAVFEAVNSDKEKHVYTTSAFMPCAAMYRAQQQGVLSDIRVKFVRRERPTRNGFYPINIVPAD